ncbi:MAG: glucosamine-6-phosphate deaminase [Bacilli bacterium]|jgi:glucosamine-6-phosphate deaminase|nr:glucosamine-6-phosphate deaminase [Bacilli bacterium]MDD3121074.1 glucosamine-6-phosphate deaminase [Bacilli bacterium]MDD4063751.1 glucosamine-6-phosphate deaminase [Bacilli bacterium]MDD4481888.1 glucosamine-6-phosphate deaminase [Bacilli bacterium]MDY0363706.1 glucosamine-6-phosphate deaminase [Bacilli bacterium]
MNVIRVKDYESLSLEAAKIVGELLKTKPKSHLGLATGSSPIGLYQNLIKMFKNNEISFKHVKTYNLDEYCGLPKEHKESYYSFMHRNLFDHVDISEKNIHLPSSEGKNLEKNCKTYNRLLHKANIDLQVLGIGSNGHIGFNEPGTSFEQETFIVKLTEKTRQDNKRFFNSIEEVPAYSITMGIKNIMQAKQILMLISGASKQSAVKQLLSGNISEDFPASVLHKHENVTIIIDDAAYGDL